MPQPVLASKHPTQPMPSSRASHFPPLFVDCAARPFAYNCWSHNSFNRTPHVSLEELQASISSRIGILPQMNYTRKARFSPCASVSSHFQISLNSHSSCPSNYSSLLPVPPWC